MKRMLERLYQRWRVQAPLPDGPAPSGARPVVVLTGAAGQVATLIRPALAAAVGELRLSDRRRMRCHAGNEQSCPANLQDPRALARAFAGADAIVHLGGIAKEAGWQALIAGNLLGTLNVFETAHRLGIRCVVHASSMHVLGGYGRDEACHEDSPPRPDSRYAVSKLWGEDIGRLYADKHGFSVTGLRIGHAVAALHEAEPANGVVGSDLAALVLLALQRRDPGYALWHAVTDYPGNQVSDGRLQHAHGFAFGVTGEPYAAARERLAGWYPQDATARRLRGGEFAAGERDA